MFLCGFFRKSLLKFLKGFFQGSPENSRIVQKFSRELIRKVFQDSSKHLSFRSFRGFLLFAERLLLNPSDIYSGTLQLIISEIASRSIPNILQLFFRIHSSYSCDSNGNFARFFLNIPAVYNQVFFLHDFFQIPRLTSSWSLAASSKSHSFIYENLEFAPDMRFLNIILGFHIFSSWFP